MICHSSYWQIRFLKLTAERETEPIHIGKMFIATMAITQTEQLVNLLVAYCVTELKSPRLLKFFLVQIFTEEIKVLN